ncbi:MAG: hypothetical protein ACPLW7_00140 [Minisyncoccia bacterium]
MYCPNCGAIIKYDAKFCQNSGFEIIGKIPKNNILEKNQQITFKEKSSFSFLNIFLLIIAILLFLILNLIVSYVRNFISNIKLFIIFIGITIFLIFTELSFISFNVISISKKLNDLIK